VRVGYTVLCAMMTGPTQASQRVARLVAEAAAHARALAASQSECVSVRAVLADTQRRLSTAESALVSVRDERAHERQRVADALAHADATASAALEQVTECRSGALECVRSDLACVLVRLRWCDRRRLRPPPRRLHVCASVRDTRHAHATRSECARRRRRRRTAPRAAAGAG
jgi:hypothetical protein